MAKGMIDVAAECRRIMKFQTFKAENCNKSAEKAVYQKNLLIKSQYEMIKDSK